MASSSEPADAEMVDVGDAPAPEEPEEELPEVSIELFNVIKSSHAQHGLRHGDYTRYRQYCTRRLYRIRKSVGFLHGKGRFVKKALEPRMVKTSKHLMLPLYAAERSWSYAMALKRENTAQEPRPRFHLLHRLNKAAKWSTTLSEICAVRGDKRTALEADAYCGFMHGNNHLEREQWGEALSNFKKTRTILQELSRVSMADQVHLYKQVIEEVDPSIRFCAYNLRGEGEDGDEDHDAEGMTELLEGGGEGAGSDILRSKLEAVLQESRARQAQSLQSLEVLGELVPIKSDKVRIAILSQQRLALEIEEAQSAKAGGGASSSVGGAKLMEQYDELFVAFNDALDGVRADQRSAAKEQSARSGATEASLSKLKASLTWQKLDHTVKRTMLLVEQFKRRLAGVAENWDAATSGSATTASSSTTGASSSSSSGHAAKRTTPDDIVRLYESALSSLAEMGTLDGYSSEHTLMEQLEARQSALKACRCYYIAETYAAVSKFPEARSLYSRANDLMEGAKAALVDAGFGRSTDEMASLEDLAGRIAGAQMRAHAYAVLKRVGEDVAMQNAAEETRLMSVGDGASMDAETVGLLQQQDERKRRARAAAGELPLTDSLEVYERARPEYLAEVPPDFDIVPCKPILFDLARQHLKPPDLSERIKEEERKEGGGASGGVSAPSSWGSYLFGSRKS